MNEASQTTGGQPLERQPGAKTDSELSLEQLDQTAGGAARRGGDDDLDDLEVER